MSLNLTYFTVFDNLRFSPFDEVILRISTVKSVKLHHLFKEMKSLWTLVLLVPFLLYSCSVKYKNRVSRLSLSTNFLIATSSGIRSSKIPRGLFLPSMSSEDSSFQNKFKSAVVTISNFYNHDLRLGFIRKVTSIVGVRTLITVIILLAAVKNRNFRRYLLQSRELFAFVPPNVSWFVLPLISSSKKLRHLLQGDNRCSFSFLFRKKTSKAKDSDTVH